MDQKRSFSWLRDLPSWGSCVGTLAIAVIGIVTIRPIIENLDLREQNRKLFYKNEKLKEEEKTMESDLRNSKEALRNLEGKIERSSKANERLYTTGKDLAAALVIISSNINRQAQREKDLSSQISPLMARISGLENERSIFVEKNRKFKLQELQQVKKLDRFKSQLKITEGKIKGAKREIRRFILETIVESTAKYTQEFSIPYKAQFPENSGFGFISGMNPEDFHVGLRAESISEEWSPLTDNSDKDKRDNKTGKDLIYKSFELKILNLLNDDERKRLVSEVVRFVNKHKDIFSAKLFVDDEIVRKLEALILVIGKMSNSKYNSGYLGRFIFSHSDLSGNKLFNPEEAPEREVAEKDREFEIAQMRFNQNIEKVIQRRRALRNSFVDMIRELP